MNINRTDVIIPETDCLTRNPAFMDELLNLIHEARNNNVCELCILATLNATFATIFGDLAKTTSPYMLISIAETLNKIADQNFKHARKSNQ